MKINSKYQKAPSFLLSPFSLFLALGSWFLVLPSCKEVGPDINLEPEDLTLIDTTYIELPAETPQNKVVLIEDFTGATCPNCPEATAKIEELEDANPGRIAVVAAFNYDSDPHPEGAYSFLTDEAYALATYLGGTIAWPATAIDRKIFAGHTDIILINEVDNYAGLVAEQLTETPPCNIYLSYTFDDVLNELRIKVTIKYTTTVSAENHLSLALTESGIIDYQTVSGVGEVEDYEHNSVLDTLVTPVTGFTLDNAVEKSPGRVFEKEFKVKIQEPWKRENMTIVAFVHNFIDNKQVLQTATLEID